MNLEQRMLVLHEGVKLKPYRCTAGKLTIGIGRNLDDVGISEGEAYVLLQNDINRVRSALDKHDWFTSLDDVRQSVVVDMGYNLGVRGLLGFRNMVAAIQSGDYSKAAAEMMDSKWARQVGRRAEHLRYMMETGLIHPIFEEK